MALALLVGTATATAQDASHVLIVTGLSGDAASGKRFAAAARVVHDSARTRWGVGDSNVVWLAEDPAIDRTRIDGRATREAVASAIQRVANRSKPGDQVLLLLVGHGSGEGADSKVSLPGADPTARDYALWLDQLSGRRVVVVVAASGSGDFLPVLSAPGRIVITATRSATERNESLFAPEIAQGLTSDAADTDKDGTTTLLEAYRFAQLAVAQSYRARNLMLTEHAQLDDNGDSAGTAAPATAGTVDGALASRTALARRGAASSDPRVATLLAERRALEVQVDQLRGRKASMDVAAYDRELERLLLLIAGKTRDIRAVERGGRP